MANIGAPSRPPRGIKVPKDTSGRLMSLVAELSISKDNEDRRRKKQQLEKDFKTSDAHLTQLVSEHRDDLQIIMESFSKISSKIATNRKRCHDVKEKLLACKKLLECKRDQIKRLWLESIEHKEVISMLKEIEDLKKVREKVEEYLKEENVFKATNLLVSSISLVEGKLADVDALKDLRNELYSLRENLHQVLVKDLHKHLYMYPPYVFLKKPKEREGDKKFRSYEEFFGSRSALSKSPLISEAYNNNFQHIAVILECISLLNRLPETLDILKDSCQKELMDIVRNSSHVMYDILKDPAYPSLSQSLLFGWQLQDQQRFLLDLLEAILIQFRYVAINHKSFIKSLQTIVTEKGMTDVSYYEMADIYSKLQATVELVVGDYLDLHNTAATQQRAPTTFEVPSVIDISSFFLRKGSVRTKNQLLFRFDFSSHAMSMKSYLQEQKDSLKAKGESDSVDSDHSDPLLVCQPSTKNITVVFKPLKKFMSEIKVALHMEDGVHCPLYAFLVDCVKVFADQTSIEINRLIEKTTNSLEAWKAVTDPTELKKAKAKTQILNSTLTLNYTLKELESLIYALPDFSDRFLQLICDMLQTYRNLCQSAYKGLIYPDMEDQRVFSVSWARDKDISRLLRSLPNWTNLQVEGDHAEVSHDYEESPEEIRFRNKEESELLIRNLSCKDSISLSEILSDPTQLHNLALMHESMEWFSLEILAFADNLPDVQASIPSSLHERSNDDGDGNTDVTVAMTTKGCLKKLVKDFEDLADTCLLVLHLEVRAHCFYFLLPLSKQESYINRKDDQEPEPEIIKLNGDLSKIDEVLAPVLQPKKIRYIFEGLGELLSTILINSVSNIKKINENGVKKIGRNIFAIQQNLAGITMTREVALDRARQYFDLLNHSFEDIFNQIVEEGPQFQEHEYSAVLQLLHNSREGIYDLEPLSRYLLKLRQILDEVAVSV